MIEQGQVAFRVQSLSLELLQETLVEARAARMGSWEHLAVPALREQGKTGSEIANLLETQTVASKDFAYGLAEEIKKELLARDAEQPIIAGRTKIGRVGLCMTTRISVRTRRRPRTNATRQLLLKYRRRPRHDLHTGGSLSVLFI